MIENSGMQVSQLLCFLMNTKLCVSSKLCFFRHHLVLCGASFSELLLYFMLAKSMQIPVGACLFVCLFVFAS
jgi:hypothetical protein